MAKERVVNDKSSSVTVWEHCCALKRRAACAVRPSANQPIYRVVLLQEDNEGRKTVVRYVDGV